MDPNEIVLPGHPAIAREDAYRQIRIFIDPSPTSVGAHLTVVARVSRRGVHRDRQLLSVRSDAPLLDLTVGQLLASAGQLLMRQAKKLD